MPPWGRPPGGRMGKKAQREWARQRSWDERRVEEIEDSDEDEEHGIELALDAPRRRYASDELHFTGIDLNVSRARRRKGNAYDEDSDSDSFDEGSEDDEDGGEKQSTQVILREKEDFLVERALERIRRARMMGKTDVKLSRAEVDALERAERIQKQTDPPKATKGKKAATTRPKKEERKKSKTDKSSPSAPQKAIEPRRKTKSSPREELQSPYPLVPGPDYGHATGAMVYAPQAYYPAPTQRPTSSRSKSGSRTGSSQSLRQYPQQTQPPPQHTPPLPQYQHPYYSGRYFSNPDPPLAGRPLSNSSLRSDPSDPNWEPRARSASNILPYPVDHPSYPMYPPPPPQFDSRDPRFIRPPGPRVASGPPDTYPVSQIPEYRSPYGEMFAHSPVPAGEGTVASDADGDEDDEDGGVEVDVIEQPGASYGIQTRSSTAAAAASASANRGRGGGSTASRGVKRGK